MAILTPKQACWQLTMEAYCQPPTGASPRMPANDWPAVSAPRCTRPNCSDLDLDLDLDREGDAGDDDGYLRLVVVLILIFFLTFVVVVNDSVIIASAIINVILRTDYGSTASEPLITNDADSRHGPIGIGRRRPGRPPSARRRPDLVLVLVLVLVLDRELSRLRLI
jgi:hypothetical protein